MLKLKAPLVFFDLETTGINVTKDRIVEIALVKVMPNGETIVKSRRINPGIPIPLESSLIHGIYDDDVADEPTFKAVAKSLVQLMEGADLAGFNIIRFDVPVLVEEFLRAGIDFDIEDRKLVDAQRIFHMMEKRTLSAAYKFYCDKELEGAHSAEVDTLATYEVFKAQMERYEGQEVVDNLGKPLGVIKNDVQMLHDLTKGDFIDFAGRMVMKNNVPVFNFGKHRGKPVLDVLSKEPSYYDWILNGDFPLDTKRKLTKLKLSQFGQQ